MGSSKGYNLMHVAVTFGWQDVVEALNGADPSMKNGTADAGITPAMEGTIHKKTGIVKFLLEQGADPTIVTDRGSNLLHYACYFGVMQVVKMLVEDHQMDVNAVGDWGGTPLQKAKLASQDAVIRYLESHGAE